jgi:hypothetical protein
MSHPPAVLRPACAEPARLGRFSSKPPLCESMSLYSDEDYRLHGPFPAVLDGKLYYELPLARTTRFECVAPGEVFALAPAGSAGPRLLELGFNRLEAAGEFQLFGKEPAHVVAVFGKNLVAGESFEPPSGTIVAGFEPVRAPGGGELLYNGIRLPKEWPPAGAWSDGEMPAPYLINPPKRISIDVGRQLFVDDFLVEHMELEREYHHPEKYAGNPVLKPETEIEKKGLNNLAVAGPKSGGLWWNAGKQLFELWYEAGWVTTVAYATSRDGLHWERPHLAVNPGTNQVLPSEIKPDSWTIVRDYRSTDPEQNFKIFLRGSGARERARGFLSKDGLDWGRPIEGGLCADRSTMFLNPFRNKWVFSLRWSDDQSRRARAYWESEDFVKGLQWRPDEPQPWLTTDTLDLPDPRIGDAPQLYNVDAVAYESLMLGFFEILHGPHNDVNAAKGLPKNTGLNFAYSRDGYHWTRPDRTMALNSEQRAVWDRGYVQSLGNLCTVRGDKLWFYYIGFAGDPTVLLGQGGATDSMRAGLYANGATGVAFLRRDGFVSLNAGASPGVVTTRPVVFSGKHLFVNVDAPHGSLIAEIIDMEGTPVEPFTFANCRPVEGDTTLAQVHWTGGDDLTALAHRAVRFRFRVTHAKFYAFWVSRDATGRSDGYVAGGGPGFTSDIDTAGLRALDENRKVEAAFASASQPTGITQ